MSVSIGCFSGFWGDSMWGAAQLVTGKADLDFLVGDYLAEVTMGILAKARKKASGGAGQGGFVREFADRVWKPLGKTILQRRIRVVTNAGGMNPQGLKQLIEHISKEQGYSVRVAAVFGDDVTNDLDGLCSSMTFLDGGSKARLDGVASANAYFGARGIEQALQQGAQVVVTGRVVDSALVLGPLVHSFSWAWNDFGLLARGSVIGHILECGCQTTGGNYTDWKDTKSWTNVGFPIAECRNDGSAVITKNQGTGGIVNCQSVTEQMLYEIGDPANYILPDVVVDFTTVSISEQGADRVAISGATGRPPTSSYKVCVTRPDGFLLAGLLLIPGNDCRAKAKRVGEAIVENANLGLTKLGKAPISEYDISVIGGSGLGEDYQECVLRVAFAHSEYSALQIAGLEIAPSALSMAQGICGVGSTGRAVPSRRMHHFSMLCPKKMLVGKHMVVVGEEDPFAVDDLQNVDGAAAKLVAKRRLSLPVNVKGPMQTVPLRKIAYARSGDKGDSANIGVIARAPQWYPYLLSQLDETAVRKYLISLSMECGEVTRFELPLVNGVNFLAANVLGGGGGSSLLYDKQGKTFAARLLQMPVQIPASAKL